MLDIKLIREQPDFVKVELEKVGFSRQHVDVLLELDGRRRAKIHETETLKAQRSARSQEIRKIVDLREREDAVTAMRELGGRIAALEAVVEALEAEFQQRLLEVPNLPHPQVPIGRDDQENVLIRTVGETPSFSFTPKPHWELGEQLGIIDFERGVKISGSRFYVLRGAGARLQRALINWMLDLHVQHG